MIPIERGYVSSLARPGGNITGVFYRQPELPAKQLELLTQTFPEKSRLAVLYDTNSADQLSAAEEAARSMPLELRPLKLEKPPYDFRRGIPDNGAGHRSNGARPVRSPSFVERRPEVAALAIEHRLPTMFVFKSYVESGGLMSYGVEQLAMYRRIGLYVAKILNGTKPADLPVEQPTRFELVVNLKTAKALGLELPAVAARPRRRGDRMIGAASSSRCSAGRQLGRARHALKPNALGSAGSPLRRIPISKASAAA